MPHRLSSTLALAVLSTGAYGLCGEEGNRMRRKEPSANRLLLS
jgi:hypothetical protein